MALQITRPHDGDGATASAMHTPTRQVSERIHRVGSKPGQPGTPPRALLDPDVRPATYFAQLSYDGVARHTSLGVPDARYAGAFTFGGVPRTRRCVAQQLSAGAGSLEFHLRVAVYCANPRRWATAAGSKPSDARISGIDPVR